jgi:hypothetical protein
LRVLEFALHLHLDAAFFAIAQIRHHFKTAIRKRGLLNAGRGDGPLHAAVQKHEIRGILVAILRGVFRQVCAAGVAAGEAGKGGTRR